MALDKKKQERASKQAERMRLHLQQQQQKETIAATAQGVVVKTRERKHSMKQSAQERRRRVITRLEGQMNWPDLTKEQKKQRADIIAILKARC